MSAQAESSAISGQHSGQLNKNDGHGDNSASDNADKHSAHLNSNNGDQEGDEQYGDAEGYDDDDGKAESGNPRERRKIEIKFILNKARRHITFSKRKHGIMKKAWELSVLTGTQVLLLVVSETGLVYTFTTPKLQPLVTQSEGKNLIQACLNAPEAPNDGNADSPDEDSPSSEQETPVHGRPPLASSHLAAQQQHMAGVPQPVIPQQQQQQSPPTATLNIGNLMDPSNNPAYAHVLAARKAQEANAQRILQQQGQHQPQSQSQPPPAQHPNTATPVAVPPNLAPANGAASMVMPGAAGTASPQPNGNNATAALQAQAMAVSGLPPHLQQFAAQGYKIAPQYGYQGYPFPAMPGQYGPQITGYPGQVGAPLDTATLIALQQQAQAQAQHQQHQQQQQQQQQQQMQHPGPAPDSAVHPEYAAMHAQRQPPLPQEGQPASQPGPVQPQQPHYT